MTQVAIAETTEETKPCVVIIRPEFMQICNNDACKSATFNHILYWISQKIKRGIQFWYATGEQIWEGMNKSWGITTIRKAVKELVGAGFLGQRRNPKVGIDQTRQYFFGKEQADVFMQACEDAHVCVMCLDIHKDISHLIDLSNGDLPFDRFVKCICQNCQMHLTDLLQQYQRLLSKITDKEESVIPGESSGESNVSSSSEDDIAHRYEKGHAAITVSSDGVSLPITLDELEATAIRLLTEATIEHLSTPNPQAMGITETSSQYHIAPTYTSEPVATCQEVEAAQMTMQPAAVPIPATSLPTSVPSRETRKRGKDKNALTLQGQHVLDLWFTHKKRKWTPGKETLEAANELGAIIANDEEFLAVCKEIDDDEYLNKHDVARDLDFVKRKYERYRDKVEQKSKPKPRAANAPQDYTGKGKILQIMREQAQAQAQAQGRPYAR